MWSTLLQPPFPAPPAKFQNTRVKNPNIGTEKTMTATDGTLFSPLGNRAIFSTFWGHFLTKLHSEPGEKGKSPLEKIHKNPVETVPQNCRFLSLVVVESVLTLIDFNLMVDPCKDHVNVEVPLDCQSIGFGPQNRKR